MPGLEQPVLPPLIGNGTVIPPPELPLPVPEGETPVAEPPVLPPIPGNDTVAPPLPEVSAPAQELPAIDQPVLLPPAEESLPLPDLPEPSQSIETEAPLPSAPEVLPALPTQSIEDIISAPPVVEEPSQLAPLQPIESSATPVQDLPAESLAPVQPDVPVQSEAPVQPEAPAQPEAPVPSGSGQNTDETDNNDETGNNEETDNNEDTGNNEETDNNELQPLPEEGAPEPPQTSPVIGIENPNNGEQGENNRDGSDSIPDDEELLVAPGLPPNVTAGPATTPASLPTTLLDNLTMQTSIVFPSGLLGAVEGPADGGLGLAPTGGTPNADEDNAAGQVVAKTALTGAAAVLTGFVVTFVL